MKMDVFDLKFKPNIFDYVLSNGVLHHTKDAKEAFKKSRKSYEARGNNCYRSLPQVWKTFNKS